MFALLVQFLAGQAQAAEPVHEGCQCRANGISYPQGQVLCLDGRLVRCEMNLNNSSWKTISQSCPQTRLNYSPIVSAQLSLLPR
jgi:hypothetical protein